MRTRALLALSTAIVVVTGCPAPADKTPPPPAHEGEGEGDAGGEGEGDVLPDELDPASLLTVDPLTSLPADGIAAFTVTAHLKSGAGLPMGGLNVTFTSSLGVVGAGAPVASDAAGLAATTLSSTESGDADVTAVVTTDAGDVALTTTLTLSFEGCRTPAQAFEEELYPKVFSR